MFGGALASANPTYTPPQEQTTRKATREYQLASIDASLPVGAQPAPPPARTAERAGSVPLPAVHPP